MLLWITIIVVVGLAVWGLLKWIDSKNSVDYTPPPEDYTSQIEHYTPRPDQYTKIDEQIFLDRIQPYLTRAVVERKVRSLFPNQDHAHILQLLDDNTPNFWGLERTQLNILKLSNGDSDRLQHYLKVANSQTELLNLIELAESPKSSLITDEKELFRGKHKKLIQEDERDYEEWLQKE